jgi:nicotinamide-nucleotide amidase
MSPDMPRPRWAEIIAVGSELLIPPRADTNSLHMTARLNDIGIEVRAKTIVGDRRADLESVLREALARTEIVILSGGLGPTDDDLTRDVIANVLGRPMAEDPAMLGQIRERFARRGARMPEVNRRQALVPQGGVPVENPLGTAPGLWLEHGSRLVIALPGPPNELIAMFDRIVDERLSLLAGAERVFRRVIKTSGCTESEVEEVAFPIYGAWTTQPLPIATTILASPGQVELHLSVRAVSADTAMARLRDAVAQLTGVLGSDIFSTDGRSLEEVVGAAVRARGWHLSVAESCTGGLVSVRLTDVPGSSDYVGLNAVTYSNESKIALLGVPADLLREHGAVSVAVALAMANGIRQRSGAEIGVGVTGVAGPTGGTPGKPVGTTVIAVTTATSEIVRTFRFPSTRLRNRQFAAQLALDWIRRLLAGVAAGPAFVMAPPLPEGDPA